MNEENKKRYYAYKGFDKDLKCRGEQFKVGETYTKDEEPNILRTCTSQGWHYCDSLDDVFRWYSNDGKNRFCQIEVLGKYTVDKYDTKATTTSFKILHEISTKEINSKLENITAYSHKSTNQLPVCNASLLAGRQIYKYQFNCFS